MTKTNPYRDHVLPIRRCLRETARHTGFAGHHRHAARRAAVAVPAALAAGGLLAGGYASASSHSPAASQGRCQADALKLSIGPGTGAAGSTYYPLDFTNAGHTTCTLDGYPGVSFVTGAHDSEVGTPAFRSQGVASHQVTLAPGGTAHATLRVQLAQNYPAAMCKPVTAHRIEVTLPGSHARLDHRLTAVTCTGKVPSGSTIGIYALQPGAGS